MPARALFRAAVVPLGTSGALARGGSGWDGDLDGMRTGSPTGIAVRALVAGDSGLATSDAIHMEVLASARAAHIVPT